MIDNLYSTIFNLSYLTILWLGLLIVKLRAPKEKTDEWKYLVYAFLFLGFGDIFHLLTRTFIYYVSLKAPDQAAYYNELNSIRLIGFGLIMTSVTMQFFYLFIYYYWRTGELKKLSFIKKNEHIGNPLFKSDVIMIALSIIRVVLIIYPQNQWGVQTTSVNFFRYITNIPLYIIGIIMIVLFIKRSKETNFENIPGFSIKDRKMIRNVAICFIISYICYSITLFLTAVDPIFGLAMIPKTLTYIVAFFFVMKGSLLISRKNEDINI